ncbi:RebB family R body protein [Dyella acidiphila]|uniref:RebB family R body protein n=1 Tax=Dyella acidiphila TaxID=2775866 RepID=A0ABR9G9J1_9GAMM|nr:RebB family R body protein [Dyella acidiphila]MBE1160728.1 RebB family R body protein [Dyella acidiphila]
MAFPTAVNNQITDAVTQSNVKVLGDAPAMALSSVYQMLAQVAGMTAQNAATNQQNSQQVGQAVTTRCVEALILSSN